MRINREEINELLRSIRRIRQTTDVEEKLLKAMLFSAETILDSVAHELRRDAIYAAGAKTQTLQPGAIKFECRELGSTELCTFYDGYASTHPDFQNPYRSVPGESH